MEVIARKKEGLKPLFIVCIAVGALLIVGGGVCFALGGYTLIPAIVLTALGLATVALSSLCWWKWKKMPVDVLAIEGEELVLPEGRYAFNQILNVSYRCPLGILKINWGKVYIELENNKKVAYAFVEDVEEVEQTLLALRLQSSNAPIDR